MVGGAGRRANDSVAGRHPGLLQSGASGPARGHCPAAATPVTELAAAGDCLSDAFGSDPLPGVWREFPFARPEPAGRAAGSWGDPGGV